MNKSFYLFVTRVLAFGGIAVLCLSSLAAASVDLPSAQNASTPQGWLRQGSSETAWARNILLVYSRGSSKRPSNYGVDHFLPYVMYVDRDMKPVDVFFDSFLFLPSVSNGEITFENSDRPSRLVDWQDYLDQIFHPKYQLIALDQTIELAQKTVHHRGMAPVFIGIPYPSDRQKAFGTLPGDSRLLNFKDPQTGLESRKQAVDLYLNQVCSRWKAAHYQHLNLVGFYWFQEDVSEPDYELVKYVSSEVHKRGYKFLWIPWFKAHGYTKWKEFGFDLCIMQPNLAFNKLSPDQYEKRIQDAADLTAQYGMGLEIELGTRVEHEDTRIRYNTYLDMGKKLGYRDEALLGYYLEFDLLGEAATSKKPEVREIYDATYRFVRHK
jgi:hypothetical protein